jgi:hypothetical protein
MSLNLFVAIWPTLKRVDHVDLPITGLPAYARAIIIKVVLPRLEI